MVNVENLKVGSERVSEAELDQRLQNIKQEIRDVGGVYDKDDKIDIVEGSLNGQFAEYLLKHQDVLKELSENVAKIKGNWEELGSKAGKGLDELSTFLKDINDSKEMKQDYDEFMDRMKNNPKTLSHMGSREIRRLNLYLGMHVDDALQAYKQMKALPKNWGNNEQDTLFYDSVWKTLENNYKNEDKFIYEDYPKANSLEPTVASLKSFAGENWDGSNNINIPEVTPSIVKVEKVKEKFEVINKKRVDANRDAVGKISIKVNEITEDEKSKFTKKDGNLMYNGEVFDENEMLAVFGEKIGTAASVGTEFVSPAEKNAMITDCKSKIFENVKNALLLIANDDIDEGDETSSTIYYEENINNFKIKLDGLDNAIKGENGFYEDSDVSGEKIKFNINNVKNYLETIQDKSWEDLEKNSSPIERGKWTIAVQIALNYLSTKDGSLNCNVVYLDGIRKDKTLKGVMEFQKAKGLKFGRRQQPDGLPGSVTIKEIIKALGGEDRQGIHENSDNGSGDESDSGSDNGSGDESDSESES